MVVDGGVDLVVSIVGFCEVEFAAACSLIFL